MQTWGDGSLACAKFEKPPSSNMRYWQQSCVKNIGTPKLDQTNDRDTPSLISSQKGIRYIGGGHIVSKG